MKFRKFHFPLFIFIVISCINVLSSSALKPSDKYQSLKSENVNFNNNNDEYQCILETPDPWDPTIPKKFFAANLSSCYSKYQTLSSLKDGYIKIDLNLAKPNTTCQWQCLIPDDIENTYTKSEWHELKDQSICDVIKVRCYTNENPDEQYYENLHVQIIPKEISQTLKLLSSPNNNGTPLYNIHIFVIDAVSRSQGIRFLPNTINYLENEMKAVHFPFYNKVAWNSWPNGDAFLFGHSRPRDNIPPSIMKNLCDNQSFSKHYFGNILQDLGYANLFNEDVYSIFENLNVTATHKLAPLGAELKKTAKYKETLFYGDHCISGLDYNIEIFQKFIDAYGLSKPKFSLNWNSQTSHDQFNWLYVADDILLKFIQKNKKELDNSYFILMGDHGPNVGEHRFSHETIALEERNPMFYISLPKDLRKADNPIVKNLKANKNKLIAHYDLYATMADIAESVGAEIPIDTTFHGKSFFKPIPDGRTCGEMGISPMYCNCRYKKANLTSENPLYQKILDSIFSKMNETIAPFTDICVVPLFSSKFQPIMKEIFYPGTTKTLKIYQVIFETLPDNGRWETYVSVKFHYDWIEIQNFLNLGNRLNPPWAKRCSNTIRDFCFCKS
uniref:Sulfatase N-terminal domain-containing protein n=1 Tax=Panagrolaimus sp. PS1159 TaxID=55785 RepID=A0AC35G3F9_9BILA